jgi:hypothetical protein
MLNPGDIVVARVSMLVANQKDTHLKGSLAFILRCNNYSILILTRHGVEVVTGWRLENWLKVELYDAISTTTR